MVDARSPYDSFLNIIKLLCRQSCCTRHCRSQVHFRSKYTVRTFCTKNRLLSPVWFGVRTSSGMKSGDPPVSAQVSLKKEGFIFEPLAFQENPEESQRF